MTRKRPTCFSLFSGCGGFDLGFKQAGFEVVGANEYDADASITYMMNLCSLPVHIHYIDGDADRERLDKAVNKYVKRNDKGEIVEMPFAGTGWISKHPEAFPTKNFWFGDVRKLKGDDILDILNMDYGEIDCVIGGPPCQGFSYAGKRNIADPRNNLVYEMGRIINELKPKTFVLENVPGLKTMMDPDGVLVLDKFAMILEEGDFGKWTTIKKAIEHQTGSVAVPKGFAKGEKKTDSEPVNESTKAQRDLTCWGGV